LEKKIFVLFDAVTFKFRIFDWCAVPSLDIRGLMDLIRPTHSLFHIKMQQADTESLRKENALSATHSSD